MRSLRWGDVAADGTCQGSTAFALPFAFPFATLSRAFPTAFCVLPTTCLEAHFTSCFGLPMSRPKVLWILPTASATAPFTVFLFT